MTVMIFRALVCCVLLGLLLTGVGNAQTQTGPHAAVSTSNVRAEPSIRARVVTVIGSGEEVEVVGLASNGSWYRIVLPDGREGYVYSKLLKPVAGQSAATAEPQPEVESASATASSASSSVGGDASGRSQAQPGAVAYFITPFSGEQIPGGRFWVRFGLSNMGVAPAGIEKQFTGHHHLLVNTGLPAMDEPIPSDDKHIHFGRGQTEYFIELPPGEHTLQLLLGDHDHIPHDPPVMSDRITVVVP